MKCQRCQKQATLHITEIDEAERVEEVHLCEECAQVYLNSEPPAKKTPASALSKSEADDSELAFESSEKRCEECGAKFHEFRNTGRLGCPHDYVCFQAELLPLFQSIHGYTRHTGKTPRRQPKARNLREELGKLKKQLQQAIAEENYEVAARLRDQIREVEGR